MIEPIKGFSKLTKNAKLEWLINNYFESSNKELEFLKSYWHADGAVQKKHDEFIENTITNFYIPLGIAPNFLINDTLYCVPMAIEESSVVAAAAKAATFWLERGGFKSKVISSVKIGHVHLIYCGDKANFIAFFNDHKDKLISACDSLTANMNKRGGGILGLDLIDKTDKEPGYYQLEGRFDTCDSMGANFINSILEQFSSTLQELAAQDERVNEQDLEVIMCILSNYTPECIVRSEVSCPIEQLTEGTNIDPQTFADKFARGVRIAQIEPYRATTHNKGIMNGIDSVVLATGNDFRAVEACAHSYAARNGSYQSLTYCSIEDGTFRFWIDMPLALGTVGGLTDLHPMVSFSHRLLGNPDAEKLMEITAAVGLAQNFSAIRSLVTTGIQKGHMKMHLLNILNKLEATTEEKQTIQKYFEDKVVSYSAVEEQFRILRGTASSETKPGSGEIQEQR